MVCETGVYEENMKFLYWEEVRGTGEEGSIYGIRVPGTINLN